MERGDWQLDFQAEQKQNLAMMSAPLPVVHPEQPVADGFGFSELHGLTPAAMNRLGATGKVFATEFAGVCEGRVANFGGHLIADDWAAAEEEAARRGLGEKIVGTFRSVV